MVPLNFLYILILTVFINTGMGIIMPVLPLLLKEYGFSISGLSLPFVVLIIARLLSKFYSGKIINYFGDKKVLIFSFILYSIVFLIYPFVETKEAFIAIRFFEGIVEGIAIVSLTDMAISFSGKNRGKLMGYFGSSFGLGFIIGPAIGGFMYDLFGVTEMFLSGFVIGLIGVVLAFMLPAISTKKESTHITLGLIKTTLHYLSYLKYYGPSIMRRTIFFSFMIILPLHLVYNIGTTPKIVAAFFSGSAIMTTLLMPFTGKLADKRTASGIVLVSLSLMGVLICLFGITNNLFIFAALFLLETLAFAFMLPAGMKVFGDALENHPKRSNIVGFFGGVTEFVTLIIAIALPIIYEFNSVFSWVLIGSLCILFALPFAKKQEVKT